MSRAVMAAAALVLLAAAGPAGAQERQAGIGSFEFVVAQYRPLIDSEFTMPPGTVGPWENCFGTSKRLMFKLHGGKALFHGYGTLEVGGGVGFFQAKGHGQFVGGGTSQETTGFRLLPLSLDLTYRLDQVWERAGIPVIPYARVALLRDQWWVTGSGGSKSMSGGTNGWSWGGGLGLVLDFIDTTLSRELERDSGIKHTMLVFEAQQAKVSDFGSSSSWDLSNDGVLMTFGLMFTF